MTLLAFAAGASSLPADPVESFFDEQFGKLESSVPGKFSLNLRSRYEIFDLDNGNAALDRDGSSVRVRFGYTTPDFNGFTAMAEGETLSRIGGEPNDIHPLDAAGDGSDINQLWVQYANADFGKAKVGRQIYTLDDHRFIGHVGWRQNIQTFDAATVDFTAIDKVSVKAFYSDAVNRVNGDYFVMDTYGVNISTKFTPALALSFFYYELDKADNAAFENETFGLRATGTVSYLDQSFKYAFSGAEQDFEDGDAGYLAGDLSTAVNGLTIGGGFEILEPGFRTPVATVHKFNGFADALLPITGFTDGLKDFYAYLGYKIPVGKGIPVKLIYHDFSPETDNDPARDGGTEIDLVASYKLNKYATLVTKYGDYSEDGGVGNAGAFDKQMFTLEMNFVY